MHLNTKSAQYKKQAQEEGQIWGKAAQREANKHDPDYSYYSKFISYRIYRNGYTLRALSNIKPGMRVLDLGCYNGWFSLELARSGAIVDAHDIAPDAIAIARSYYKKCKAKEKFSGQITYHVTDLNTATFPKEAYDVVVFRGILHHVGNLDGLIPAVSRALKPGGLVVADDGLPCGKKEALAIGGLLMLLPTDIPYHRKFQRVFRKGNIVGRTQGLVDSKHGSPFEGITGKESVDYLREHFTIRYYTTFAAFIGVLASQVRVQEQFKVLFLRVFNVLDRASTLCGILQGSVYYLEGEKRTKAYEK